MPCRGSVCRRHRSDLVGPVGHAFSRLNFSAMAALKLGIARVSACTWSDPCREAVLAASLMKAGVSKSGSPAPKPTTSTPAFRSARQPWR